MSTSDDGMEGIIVVFLVGDLDFLSDGHLVV